MRKVIVSMNVTLDGFMAGDNGTLDWHFPLWNDEMTRHIADQLQTVDTILLGRMSYQVMAQYWPYADCHNMHSPAQMDFANRMNNYTKILFSRTLRKGSWKNTHIIRSRIKEQILEMKQQPGRDMIIFGSGSIVQTFTRLGLVDEYRLWVHPVILQNGMPLFRDKRPGTHLQLLRTKTFSTGVVVLYYKAVPQGTVNNLYIAG